ncbi:MAG: porin family protein [Spirochaetales bacterium]|nr:porin family protein [Spirochaetales bacterium]
MIRKSLFCIVFLILPFFVWADNPLRLSVVGSITAPFYTGAGFDAALDGIRETEAVDEVIPNPIIGFTLGSGLEYSFNNFFALQGEILLAGAGGGYVLVDNGVREAHLISEINLDIPLMLKLNKELEKGRSVYVMAGPQVSLLLYESEFVQDGHAYDKHKNSRDHFNPAGIGILTALGWRAPLDNVETFLELRYGREFSRSLKNSGANYQNVIGMAAGLQFRRKGEQS